MKCLLATEQESCSHIGGLQVKSRWLSLIKMVRGRGTYALTIPLLPRRFLVVPALVVDWIQQPGDTMVQPLA